MRQRVISLVGASRFILVHDISEKPWEGRGEGQIIFRNIGPLTDEFEPVNEIIT